MTERERVIKAFEFCLMPPSREELENNICSHEDCPYYREYNGGKCVSAAAKDALALLKAQEPRVMTLEEVESAEVVWFEARKSLYIEPILTRGEKFNDSADWFKYGQDWRCWTSRPDEKRRDETPWES